MTQPNKTQKNGYQNNRFLTHGLNRAGLFAVALLTGCLMSGTTLASEQIARDQQCFKCHAIDSKKKAPSFRTIAQRSDAAEIKDVVRNGITSLFGQEKMPANRRISESDLNALTQWILAQ
jgi:cytochrome c551/c552